MRFHPLVISILVPTLALAAGAANASAQRRPAPPAPAAPAVSAPITDVHYDVAYDSAATQGRTLHVTMTFGVAGTAPVLLSLPAWTPGAYEISNFARNVMGFAPTTGDQPLRWDKLDYDTWRVRPGGAGTVQVAFDYVADSLDNAMAWTRPDFAFFNGTNVFLYPEGRSADFPATVTITTRPDWAVVTSMHPAGAPRTYRERNYHDLVDMPFFIGRVDLDSTTINGKVTRFASYPRGALTGAARDSLERRVSRIIPAEANVTGETPWDSYSVLLVFDSSYGGSASALEHQASHLGVYGNVYLQPAADTIVTSVTAHEIFHSWNVKRLRPADMVPYRYAAPEPTVWLWVSEGITDYYADLALARAGVYDSTGFVDQVAGKISTVANAPPTALEDASLSTWIHPKDGSGYIYYPKGSLAGFMLDIIIRDASNNARSLDTVMRSLYQRTYKHGEGFTGAEWWAAVRAAAGGRSFDDFAAKYVDGREPYPWATILPLAGLRQRTDTTHVARIGISTRTDSTSVTVMAVVPGSSADQAGVHAGDQIVSLGGITVQDPKWPEQFRERYNSQPGADLPIGVRRDGQLLTLAGKVNVVPQTVETVEFNPNASARAVRIRNGIITGR